MKIQISAECVLIKCFNVKKGNVITPMHLEVVLNMLLLTIWLPPSQNKWVNQSPCVLLDGDVILGACGYFQRDCTARFVVAVEAPRTKLSFSVCLSDDNWTVFQEKQCYLLGLKLIGFILLSSVRGIWGERQEPPGLSTYIHKWSRVVKSSPCPSCLGEARARAGNTHYVLS